MKAYTDLEQSKKLAEILPIESADMCYLSEESLVPKVIYNGMAFFDSKEEKLTNIIPCWSLAALLDVLPDECDIVKGKMDVEDFKYMGTVCIKDKAVTAYGNNLLDTCYELIIKLNERKML